MTDILERNLGISHAVTGFDFHFGKDRQGGPAFLMAAGERHGFGVSLVDAFRDEGAEIVSSSRIRALLGEGDVAEAAGLLGYRYTVAEASRPRQAARPHARLPTANMALPADDASSGTASMRCGCAAPTASLHDGVASFGRRPTVDVDGAPLLETFVFDFSGDLYGETCAVSFFGFLRGEEKFDGLDALVGADAARRGRGEGAACRRPPAVGARRADFILQARPDWLLPGYSRRRSLSCAKYAAEHEKARRDKHQHDQRCRPVIAQRLPKADAGRDIGEACATTAQPISGIEGARGPPGAANARRSARRTAAPHAPNSAAVPPAASPAARRRITAPATRMA